MYLHLVAVVKTQEEKTQLVSLIHPKMLKLINPLFLQESKKAFWDDQIHCPLFLSQLCSSDTSSAADE